MCKCNAVFFSNNTGSFYFVGRIGLVNTDVSACNFFLVSRDPLSDPPFASVHHCARAAGNERPTQANYSVGTKNSEQDAENSAKEDRVWLLSTRQLVSRVR